MRISYEEMFEEFKRVLLKYGFHQERAELCASLFADSSRDGVYSHGLNRFPRFIESIKAGIVKVDALPEKIEGFGALERWDGNLGAGNLNAHHCMDRAIELARTYGIGCVGLGNTNHWMRPGAYGLQAADKGCISICWTNTYPNLPPWGAVDCKLGNNPIVFAVPRKEGHILLDMAMSMYSYGKMESYAMSEELLPLEGGFDMDGKLTRDAKEILKSRRVLPIGYWKGSGMSLLLDIIAMVLSSGKSTYELGKQKEEYGISQTFITIDISKLNNHRIEQTVNDVLEDLHSAIPAEADKGIFYPGERMMATRYDNMEKGIPVQEYFWKQVLEL